MLIIYIYIYIQYIYIFVHNRIWIAIALQCFTHLLCLFPRFTSFASSMPATFSNFTPVSGSILMASSMQPLPECIKCVTRCCTTPLSIQSHYIPLPWFDMICLQLHNSSHWLPRSSKIFKNLPRPWTTTAQRCQAMPSIMICALPWFPSPGMPPAPAPPPWERKKSKPRKAHNKVQ